MDFRKPANDQENGLKNIEFANKTKLGSPFRGYSDQHLFGYNRFRIGNGTKEQAAHKSHHKF